MSSKVLASDGAEPPEGSPPRAALTATGRILVPVDFSACSLAALEHALSMALRFGSSIDLLYVWTVPRTLGPDDPVTLPGHAHQSVADLGQHQANHSLDELISDLAGRVSVVVRGQVERGQPSKTIVRVASEGGHDLIVMGTHGHTGLDHLLRGSVAEEVVHRAPCPVLTIRVVDTGMHQDLEDLDPEAP